MYFLDTNALIWLYQGEIEKFTSETKLCLEVNDLYISPLVKLELQYLYEVNRISEKAEKIIKKLYETIGLSIHNAPLVLLVEKALHADWTRDPFDRLITAHALLEDAYLVTKDKTILTHYKKAIW